ncbi:MAG TPA: ABC transporter, partial [Clostridiales bacterium]|nr:ABC transporter [Clostridiales bacterium]
MIKKLLSSVREYKKDTILSPVYVTFESILEIIIPTLMAFLIDNGINQKNMPYVLQIGLALVAAAALSLLTGVLAGRSAAVASAGFAKNLRRDMFYRV